jgi:predicted enzyme related to lactoylglutathione lyase
VPGRRPSSRARQGAVTAKLGLVLDCTDPDRLGDFWSGALGYTTLGGAGSYVLLVDEAKQRPKLLLQRVDEPKAGKNRMHLDVETEDVDGEVRWLEELGATRLEDPMEEHGSRWVVMADPEGNEFCVCTGTPW